MVEQTKFIEKTKKDLLEELKQKEDDLRFEKHCAMAVTGTQCLQKEESIWWWQFLALPNIKERCSNIPKGHKRSVIREFISEYPVLMQIVARILERKQRKTACAKECDVVNTLIASLVSFQSNSRF